MRSPISPMNSVPRRDAPIPCPATVLPTTFETGFYARASAPSARRSNFGGLRRSLTLFVSARLIQRSAWCGAALVAGTALLVGYVASRHAPSVRLVPATMSPPRDDVSVPKAGPARALTATEVPFPLHTGDSWTYVGTVRRVESRTGVGCIRKPDGTEDCSDTDCAAERVNVSKQHIRQRPVCVPQSSDANNRVDSQMPGLCQGCSAMACACWCLHHRCCCCSAHLL